LPMAFTILTSTIVLFSVEICKSSKDVEVSSLQPKNNVKQQIKIRLFILCIGSFVLQH